MATGQWEAAALYGASFSANETFLP